MSEALIFQRLALIGVGLIGSSIARAARLTGTAGSIVATARSEATRKRVAELKLADAVVDTNAEAVAGADLVIMCIPVGACGETAREIAPHLAKGAVISDVGSTTFISFPRTRSPALSIPARMPDSPSCSSTAGAFSRRAPRPTRAPSSGSPPSGKHSATGSSACRRSIMIWSSQSPAISLT